MKLPNMTPAEIDAELVGTEYNDDTANAEALRMGAITIGEAKARNDAKLNAARAIKLQRQMDELVEALNGAKNEVQEEINLSNYDHETVGRISRMWFNAYQVIDAALAKIKEGK